MGKLSKSILAVFFLLFASVAYGQLDDIHKQTCKVYTKAHNRGDGVGTGTFIKETDEHLYVLTAGHVTSCGDYIWCFLSHEGLSSDAIPASVEFQIFSYKNIDEDVAILKVNKKDINYTMPAVAEINYNIEEGEKIYTCGHPKGGYTTSLIGRLVGLRPGGLVFNPSVIAGRSGSGLFNNKGLIGVVVRGTNKGEGQAVYVKTALEIIKKYDEELYNLLTQGKSE